MTAQVLTKAVHVTDEYMGHQEGASVSPLKFVYSRQAQYHGEY